MACPCRCSGRVSGSASVVPDRVGLVENGKEDGPALLGDEVESLWRRGDELVHVEAQVFDVLTYLVEHRDGVVLKTARLLPRDALHAALTR